MDSLLVLFGDILRIVATVIITVLVMYIKVIPELHKNLILQSKEHDNNRNLQQEAYYRQLSGEKIEKLFEKWTNFLVDLRTIENMDEDTMYSITSDVFMYGSDETINSFAKYMKSTYRSESIQNELGEDFSAFQIYIFSLILSQLKYDFTGFKVNPLTFIKAKINDYDDFFDDDTVERITKYTEKL